jgi:hypothetical protein
MMYAVEMISDGMTHIYQVSYDRFRKSSNIKCITKRTWEAVMLVLLTEGIYELRRRDGINIFSYKVM